MPTDESKGLFQKYKLKQGQFRILHLQSAAAGCHAQLQGTMSICSLDRPKIIFETLSYVWGDSSLKESTIVIDGYVLHITNILASALHQLRTRDPDHDLRIWIDAICIDQTDEKEKAVQIALMGDIYRCCSHVNIWLLDPMDATISLDTTVHLQELFSCIASEHFHNIPGFFTDEGTGQLMFEETSEFTAAWKGFRLVTESLWWTRSWTVQEAILPPRLSFMYGSAEPFDSKIIDEAESRQWQFGKGIQPCCSEAMALFPQSKMEALYEFFDKYRKISVRRVVGKTRDFDGRDLFYMIVRSFADRSCQEPRDIIYSLWSQTIRDCYKGHTPSYCKPLEDVFLEVFKCMIQEAQTNSFLYAGTDFRVLYGPGFGPDEIKKPTWVPSFKGAMSSQSVESYFDRLAYSRLFGASGWEKSTLRLMGHDELHLDGVYIDRIRAVGGAVTNVDIRTNCKRVFDEWWDMVRTITTEKTERTRHDLARLLCGDVYHERQTHTRRVGRNTRFFLQNVLATHWIKLGAEIGLHMMANSEWWRRASPEDYLCDEFDQLWESGDLSRVEDMAYKKTVMAALMDRALYVTEDRGMMGLCMPHARAGDEVWIVYGSKLPFVLRPVGQEVYNLIGDCYLQGAMDGEFLGTSAHVILK